MCACTAPDGTGFGAVYVECGEQTWPEQGWLILVHYFKPPFSRTSIYDSLWRAFGSRFTLARLIKIYTLVTFLLLGMNDVFLLILLPADGTRGGYTAFIPDIKYA